MYFWYLTYFVLLVHICPIANEHLMRDRERRANRPPLFYNQTNSTTYPGHYLGEDKLNRRPCSLWIAAGPHSLRDAKPCKPPGKNTDHEMCDLGRWDTAAMRMERNKPQRRNLTMK